MYATFRMTKPFETFFSRARVCPCARKDLDLRVCFQFPCKMSAHIPPPPPEARRQPISRKETTAVYGQIRATLLNNRVLYATSKKSILAARDVLEVTPELRQERLRVEQDLVASGHDVPVQSDAEDDEGDPASDTAASRAARREVAYKAAQLETRTFLCECLNRIVGILLDQFPMRVELRYQEIINVCLFESTYGECQECQEKRTARWDKALAGVVVCYAGYERLGPR